MVLYAASRRKEADMQKNASSVSGSYWPVQNFGTEKNHLKFRNQTKCRRNFLVGANSGNFDEETVLLIIFQLSFLFIAKKMSNQPLLTKPALIRKKETTPNE